MFERKIVLSFAHTSCFIFFHLLFLVLLRACAKREIFGYSVKMAGCMLCGLFVARQAAVPSLNPTYHILKI